MRIDIGKLREDAGIEEVLLALFGWHPTARSGQQLRGPCPLHETVGGGGSPGKCGSRVFAVHTGLQKFHCFKCGRCGDVLDLAAEAWPGLGLVDRGLRLAHLLRMPLNGLGTVDGGGHHEG